MDEEKLDKKFCEFCDCPLDVHGYHFKKLKGKYGDVDYFINNPDCDPLDLSKMQLAETRALVSLMTDAVASLRNIYQDL